MGYLVICVCEHHLRLNEEVYVLAISVNRLGQWICIDVAGNWQPGSTSLWSTVVRYPAERFRGDRGDLVNCSHKQADDYPLTDTIFINDSPSLDRLYYNTYLLIKGRIHARTN